MTPMPMMFVVDKRDTELIEKWSQQFLEVLRKAYDYSSMAGSSLGPVALSGTAILCILLSIPADRERTRHGNPNYPAPPAVSILSIQVQVAVSFGGRIGRRPSWPAGELYQLLPVASQGIAALQPGVLRMERRTLSRCCRNIELSRDPLSTAHYSGNAECFQSDSRASRSYYYRWIAGYSLQRVSCVLVCISLVDSRGSCFVAPSWGHIPMLDSAEAASHCCIA